MDENKDGVTKAEQPAVSAPETKAPESSPEVKTEKEQIQNIMDKDEKTETPEVVPEKKEVPPKNADKMQEQIDNLNIALKEEREKPKADPREVERLKGELTESKVVIDKLKNVFVPEKEEEETPEEVPQGLTQEQAEAIWEEKSQAKEKLNAQKNEIVELEKEWNGKEGKPQYEDEKVLKWQQENNKLYLSPRDAFVQMKEKEILDYKVNERIKGKPTVENVETPTGGEGEHTPEETKPKTEEEIRKAVFAEMDSVGE